MNTLTSILFLALMLTVLMCVFLDLRRKRPASGLVPLTVIVPCYNDAETVADTLRSVFASWPAELLEVIAVNDASRDDSLARIQAVAREFTVRIIGNRVNSGKTASLNRTIAEARNELVLCLDADSLLSTSALMDMMSRFAHNSAVGAVSCPYRPTNRGFLPAMQAIEYSMLRIGQGAGNVTSALALWGGCLMVRRSAFDAVNGFSLNAITEDVDLAFKLNRAGWKVEQSFVFINTMVPSSWRAWIRQKIRWTSGGFQCTFKYPGVWLRNPLQMLFILSYAALTISGMYSMLQDASLLGAGRSISGHAPLLAEWRAASLSCGPALLGKLAIGTGFSLFALVYVIPTISRIQDWMRIVLVIPFSLGYFPLYLLVSLLGFAFWFLRLRPISRERRAW